MSVSGLFSCSMDAPGLGVDGLKYSGFPLPREWALKPITSREVCCVGHVVGLLSPGGTRSTPMGGKGPSWGGSASRASGSAQPGPSWPGAAAAPCAPCSLPGVVVLTQCGLLRSRQALTKNTFAVRRELPRHVLLFCFPLRVFLAPDLSWSLSRVFPPVPALWAGCLRSDGVKQSWWEVPAQGVSATQFANKGL